MGFSGAAAWAGWIDGLVQLTSDWNLCLSVMQKANRFALSLALGLAGGAAAGLGFAGATTVVAALAGAGIIASPVVIVGAPILVGAAAGYGFAAFVERPLKDAWYWTKPDWFVAP
jgi:hypothetical protein